MRSSAAPSSAWLADLGGGIFPAGGLHDSVNRGAIVIRRLHGPYFVSLWTEGFGSIAFHSHIDNRRHAIRIDQEISHIVVVVALAVVSPCAAR